MRFLLIVCMLLALGQPLVAQEGVANRTMPTPDNYAWAMGLTSPTDEEITRMIPIAENFFEVNYDSAFALAYNIVSIDLDSTELADSSVVRLLYTKALILNRKQQNEQAQPIIEQALQRAEPLDNVLLTAEIKSMLGRVLADRRKLQKALELFNTAAAGFGMTGDTVNWVKNRVYSARVIGYIDSWKTALTILEKLFPVAQRTQDTILISEVLYWKGVAYGSFFLQYYNKIRNSDSENERSHLDSVKFYYRLANDYYNQVKSATKKYNYRKYHAVSLGEQIDNIIYYDNVMKNNKKDAAELKRYSDLLNEMKMVTDDLNADEFKLLYYFSAGKVAVEQSDYATSIAYGEKIVELAKKNDNIAQVVLGYYSMANGYYGAKDFKNAYKYIERTYQTQIEKITTDNSKTLLELETQYQTAQKEKEIFQQRNDILELETANAAVVKQRNYLLGGSLFLAIMTFFGYQLNKTRRERNDKIAFADALMYAQEEERKRIAHDLHDGIGQSLLLIKKQIEGNQSVSMENRSMITQTLEEVRSMSRDLHPFQIEKFGLTESINDMIGKVDKSTDLFITKEIAEIDQAFLEKQQIHVFRAIQEALNNIVKHSNATAAKVTIEKFSKIVLITILDNGKGFDYELAVARSKSLGLRTMHERVTNIGGELKFSKNNQKGTKVEIRIPV